MKRTLIFLVTLVLALAFTACGDTTQSTAPTEASATTLSPSEAAPTPITNVDDFLAAIAPDTEILLGEGDFYLHAAADFGQSTSPWYVWAGSEGDYTLTLTGVSNLTIRGAGPGKTNLLTDPRSVHVLELANCKNVVLEGMSLGHTVRAEACEGNVLRLRETEDTALRNLDLYGCGAVGIDAYHCGNLEARDCTIHDCSLAGASLKQVQNACFRDCAFRSIGASSPAQQVLAISNCGPVTLDRCDISGNYVRNVLYSASTDDAVTIRETSFSGNQAADSVFCFFGDQLILDKNTYGETQIRTWYGEGSTHGVDSMGTEVTFEEAAAQPAGPIEAEPVSTGPQTEVHVSTVDEFLKALQSDTCILLDAPLYDLSTASEYEAVEAEVARSDWGSSFDGAGEGYYWEYAFEGPGLVIENLHNLTIKAEGEDRAAHVISATPRHATVLTFENCSAITLSGFTAGHTREPGACTGGVVLFRNCEDLLVDHCGLFGCGTIGVRADACRNLQVVSSEIYECSLSGITLTNTETAAISGTLIRDIGDEWNSGAPFYVLDGCTGVTLDGKPLDGFYQGR